MHTRPLELEIHFGIPIGSSAKSFIGGVKAYEGRVLIELNIMYVQISFGHLQKTKQKTTKTQQNLTHNIQAIVDVVDRHELHTFTHMNRVTSLVERG